MDPLALTLLPPSLVALHTAYFVAASVAREDERRYTRAEAATRRARRAWRAGQIPVAALRSAEAAQDAAWDAWTASDGVASRAWWTWEREFSAHSRATAAGLVPILPQPTTVLIPREVA